MKSNSDRFPTKLVVVLLAVVILAVILAWRNPAAAQKISPDDPDIAEPYVVGSYIQANTEESWLFCFDKVHLDAILDVYSMAGESASTLFKEKYAMQVDPETNFFRCGMVGGDTIWKILEAWPPKPHILNGRRYNITVMLLTIPFFPDSKWNRFYMLTTRKVLPALPHGKQARLQTLGPDSLTARPRYARSGIFI